MEPIAAHVLLDVSAQFCCHTGGHNRTFSGWAAMNSMMSYTEYHGLMQARSGCNSEGEERGEDRERQCTQYTVIFFSSEQKHIEGILIPTILTFLDWSNTAATC